ncbi:MAG: hypothetical protein K6E99_05555 [Bacilli bacterium]|nr:hypothetical protein [Bacilli bacterium]
MEEENKKIDIVLTARDDIKVDDDLFPSVYSNEDTLDLTEVVDEVKKTEGDKIE